MPRLDAALAQHGIVKSRTLAQNMIKDGNVLVNNEVCRKCATEVADSDIITLGGELPKYVGRGGLKLEKAIDEFGLNLKDAICVDIGSSTGGFTDCMLQNGAARVYAVDVGTDQLDEKLRADKRVISMEKTDIRECALPEKADFISIDVSFISLSLVFPAAYSHLKTYGNCVALIKPQFEAGRKALNKKGIVTDKKIRENTVKEISEIAVLNGFTVNGTTESAIKGGDGNVEYLIYLTKNGDKI